MAPAGAHPGAHDALQVIEAVCLVGKEADVSFHGQTHHDAEAVPPAESSNQRGGTV